MERKTVSTERKSPMSSLDRLYMEQVRAALHGEPVTWPEEQSEALLRLHWRQGTGALVFPSVLEQGNQPASVRTLMKSVCVNTIQNQVKLQHTLEEAWQALEKAGVRAVLMKGAGLAVYYPTFEQRAWGDIDLFVGKEQYHRAAAVMRETFPDALKFDEELEHYKHYNLIADGVSIEVHRVTVSLTHPLDERRYARMEAYGMSHSQELVINGLTVRVPDPTFNALLVFLHSWEHMLSAGANVRQLCDLALLLQSTNEIIKKPVLRQWLKELKLLEIWQLYMCVIEHGLGLPASVSETGPKRLRNRADLLLEDLLNGRMTAPRADKEAPKGKYARKFFTMRVRLANAKRIKRYSPSYARHMVATVLLSGLRRLFAKDRKWE